MNFLACDLGRTKVLLGIFEKIINDDSPKLIFKKKYLSSNWDSFDLILEDFLKNECKNITHPSSACFAVAGPLSNNNAKIMNLSCLLYTSPSPRDKRQSRMPSSA